MLQKKIILTLKSGISEGRDCDMVKEIDGFQERKEQEKEFDPHYEIASNIFKRPPYSLNRYSWGIDIFIDEHPELNTHKSLPRAVEIRSNNIEVIHPQAYQDSRRMAKELEKKIGKEVTLKTTYCREG